MGVMDSLETLSEAYGQAKFWIICIAIFSVGVVYLPHSFHRVSDFVVPAIALPLLPIALWQTVQRMRFFRWVRRHWDAIVEGGQTHPGEYLVTLDTEFVRYSAVFSAVFVTVNFESRPYPKGQPSAWIAKIIFTLYSTIFGWWFLGLSGILNTGQAIYYNLKDGNTFTLRQLAS